MKRRDCRALSSGQAGRLSYRRARNDRRAGYTLIEVVLAIVVITIAVSATLVVMSKMMSYTVSKGQAIDISNAVTVSQMAIDQVRDQRFPPIRTYGNLESTSVDSSIAISNITYTYSINIVAFDDSNITSATEYGSNGDLMPSNHNLLKVTATVYKNGRPLLKTVTYKTRNGYY